MGSAKDQMEENAEEQRDRKLADVLGISYDDLLELDHFVEPNDDETGTVVTLGNMDNKEIIKKLKHQPDNTGRIDLDAFEFPTN